MSGTGKAWVVLLSAGLAAATARWWLGAKRAGRGDPQVLLLDDSASPAPFALSLLQETPQFGQDQSGKPFAMIEDQNVRREGGLTAATPMTLSESEPDASGATKKE
jgi:hypothetical protein